MTSEATGTFWVLDCCISGDIWTITGDLAGVSSFYVGGALHPTLDALAEWSSADHSKLEISGIAPGTYMFTLSGNGVGGVRAGVYLAATQVPEPAMWAMMIAGFGLVGYASRRRSAMTAY